MTRDEYERGKALIEEQHRAAIELMENARKAQLRALELVWLVQGEGATGNAAALLAATPAAPVAAKQEAPPEPLRRKTSTEMANDIVRSCYWRLPETFTRNDVLALLDYEPDRATLSRGLQTLVGNEHIRIEEKGAGHRPTIYRRTPPPKRKPDAPS